MKMDQLIEQDARGRQRRLHVGADGTSRSFGCWPTWTVGLVACAFVSCSALGRAGSSDAANADAAEDDPVPTVQEVIAEHARPISAADQAEFADAGADSDSAMNLSESGEEDGEATGDAGGVDGSGFGPWRTPNITDTLPTQDGSN